MTKTKGDKPAPSPSIVIRPRDWMRELGVGKQGLTLLIRDHGHPKPFPLGKRSSGFDRSECEAWLESRKAQRQRAEA